MPIEITLRRVGPIAFDASKMGFTFETNRIKSSYHHFCFWSKENDKLKKKQTWTDRDSNAVWCGPQLENEILASLCSIWNLFVWILWTIVWICSIFDFKTRDIFNLLDVTGQIIMFTGIVTPGFIKWIEHFGTAIARHVKEMPIFIEHFIEFDDLLFGRFSLFVSRFFYSCKCSIIIVTCAAHKTGSYLHTGGLFLGMFILIAWINFIFFNSICIVCCCFATSVRVVIKVKIIESILCFKSLINWNVGMNGKR